MKSWVSKLLIAICLLMVGALVAIWTMSSFFSISPFGTSSETRNTQVINSTTLEEQVVLLSLGIQGIEQKTGGSIFFGMNVPGSERTTFIQYSFSAKLGIEGKDVVIKQTGADEFLVSIPKFIFIGHHNEDFKLVAENNGILSFVTPEIDRVEMINNILNDKVQNQYLDQNKEILKDQAKAFYKGIITSIDPTIVVTFVFQR